MLVLVMVRVDIDDQDVVELALMRLLARVREQPRGVELLDGYAAAAIGYQVHVIPFKPSVRGDPHGHSSIGRIFCAESSAFSARPALPHAEFEHGELAACNRPLAVIITSVAASRIFRHRRQLLAGLAARGVEPARGRDQRLQRFSREHVEPAVGDAALDVPRRGVWPRADGRRSAGSERSL